MITRAHLPARLRGFLCRGLLGLLAAAAAHAHDPFEITTLARLQADTLELEITMARSTALAVASGNPEAPTFKPADFEKHRPEFEQCAPNLYTLTLDGVPLALRSVRVALGREEDVDFFVVYPRPPGGMLRLTARHVGHLAYGYGALLTVRTQDQVLGSKLLMAGDPVLEVALPAVPAAKPSADRPPSAQAPVAQAPAPAPPGLFGQFLRLGWWHILTGYDHLVFLLGLLIVGQRTRTLVGIVTCFTIAHSITLALAALGVVTIPPAVVEPLIAASIVYVGVENLLRREEPKGRWLLTLLFGLIHGFGFSGALRQAGLGSSGTALAVPLLSFNLGVELGQLAVIAVVLPLLAQVRQRPVFAHRIRPAVSALVAVAGAAWLLQRTLLS